MGCVFLGKKHGPIMGKETHSNIKYFKYLWYRCDNNNSGAL